MFQALKIQKKNTILSSYPIPVIANHPKPIGSMYGIYANIGGILVLNVTIYGIHGSYGKGAK